MKKYGKMAVCAAILTALLIGIMSGSFAFAEDAVQFEGDLPYRGMISGISEYKSTKIEVLTADEAKAQEVPDGYEGSIYKMTGKTYTGVTFDYTDKHISAYTVESITFRVLAPSGTEELRVKAKSGDDWVVKYDFTATERKHWVDITISSDGKNLLSGKKMADLGYEDGFIHTLCVCFRFPDEKTDTSYVDNITINCIESNDKTAPELKYTGKNTIYRTAEKPLIVDGIYAYDAYEDREIKPVYEWNGECGLDENGLLKEGTYNLVIAVSDTMANTSRKQIKLEVGPKDTEAPEILLNSEDIYTYAGVYPNMIIKATDNEDKVTAESKWITKGALDTKGALTEGEHQLRITSTDLTGNTAEKVVTFHVAAAKTESDRETVRDESKIDFGWPGRIVFISLIALTAVLAAIVIIADRKEKEPEI